MKSNLYRRMSIRELSKDFRSFVNTLSDWVWEMDLNGIHTFTNNAVENILGYRPKEILGKHVTLIWPNDLATTENIETFNEELKEGLPWDKFRGKFKHKDGSSKILESSGVPIFDTEGQLMGFRGVDRDITQQVENERKLQESEQTYRRLSGKLEASNNIKALLLDIITHDIKNPAGVIKGMGDILIRNDPENQEYALIHSSVNNLLKVIENATALSKIAMAEEIEFQSLSVKDIVEDAITENQRSLKEVGISVENKVTGSERIKANPIVMQIFKNFLTNAGKYAREGKKVVVSTESTDTSISICVADFGTTIPESERERIFHRTIQLEEQKRRGRGLGLAISRRIAEAHHAGIGVRPNQPQGNVFYCTFPLQESTT